MLCLSPNLGEEQSSFLVLFVVRYTFGLSSNYKTAHATKEQMSRNLNANQKPESPYFNHRITLLLRLNVLPEIIHLNLLLRQGQLERLSRTISGQALNISTGGGSTTSLGNLLWCLTTTLTVNNFFF